MYTQFDIPSVRNDDTNHTILCKALAEDKHGNIWATLYPDYLAKFDVGLKKWTKKMQLPDGLYASMGVLNYVNFGLCVDRKGNVWVGTREEGVDVYTGEATGVTDAEAVDDTFAHTWIFSVAPNPVIHSARAQIFADPALRASLRVGVYSLQGELLSDVTDKVQIDAVSGHGTVELEPAGLPTGAYMLRVANGSDYHCTMIAVIK